MAHLAGFALLLVLWVTGVVHQGILRPVLAFGVPALLYYGLLVRHAAQES